MSKTDRDEEELEAAIEAAYQAMLAAQTWRETRAHQERMYELIDQRSVSQKNRMEKERGLR